MGAFATIVEVMAGMDVFQLFFPWLLILGLSYGILEQYEFVSDDSSVNGVIALSFAFFTIGGAYIFLPAGTFTQLAALMAFGLFGILGLVVLMGVAGYDIESIGEDGTSIPVLAAVAVAIVAFAVVLMSSFNIGGLSLTSANFFEDVVMPILVLVFMGGIVYWTLNPAEE